MKSGDVIDALQSCLKGDRDRVLSAIARMEAHERSTNKKDVADRLGYLLRHYGNQRGAMIQLPNAWHGLTVLQPRKTFDDLILDDQIRADLTNVAVEHSKRDILAENGLRPRNRLLFHGPPGNGKTSAAEAIAHSLDVPFLLVNHHDLIDSHLGESQKNLANAMRSAANQSCVLFIDELDAVGMSRTSGDAGCDKEMNRVVSGLLMQLDAMPPCVTFIGATNREELLDHALARRFDSAIRFPSPNAYRIEAHVAALRKRHPILAKQEINQVELAGLSYAEIETRLMNVARTILIAL